MLRRPVTGAAFSLGLAWPRSGWYGPPVPFFPFESFQMASILFVTCCDNGAYGLRKLVEAGADVVAAVTIPPELGEKYRVSGYADIAPFCEANGIPVITLDKYKIDPALLDAHEFDVLVVAGWNRLITEDVYGKAKYGGIGLHSGHPPIGLGRAPIVWNIIKGFSDIEVYAFSLTPRADDGDVLAVQPVEITPYDTARSLYEKVMLANITVMRAAVDKLARGERGTPQNLDYAEHYDKRTPVDGWIDFTQHAGQIYDFVRAQSEPYPGAFAYLGKEKWTIFEATPFDRFAFRDAPRIPGMIVDVLPLGPVVITASETLWLRRVVSNGETLGGWEAKAADLRGRILTPEPVST